MTIYSQRDSKEHIPAALEKLEAIRKLAAEMGGEVMEYLVSREIPSRPVLDIKDRDFYLRLDIRFPINSCECTPQSASQEEGNT